MAFEPPPTQAKRCVGSAFPQRELRAGFAANAGVKIAGPSSDTDAARERSEKVVRGANIGDPVAHGFVDGVLERATAELTPTTSAPSMRMRET